MAATAHFRCGFARDTFTRRVRGRAAARRANGRSRERTGADESGRAQIRAAELGPERTRENEGGLHERDATTRVREVR